MFHYPHINQVEINTNSLTYNVFAHSPQNPVYSNIDNHYKYSYSLVEVSSFFNYLMYIKEYVIFEVFVDSNLCLLKLSLVCHITSFREVE